jgi:hypothetical protein
MAAEALRWFFSGGIRVLFCLEAGMISWRLQMFRPSRSRAINFTLVRQFSAIALPC